MSLVIRLQAKLSRARYLASRLSSHARSAKGERKQFYLELWQAAAAEVGATATLVGRELIRIDRQDQFTFVDRNYTDLDGPATLRACGNKPMVHRLLNAEGIPTPPHREFDLGTLSIADQFLSEQGTCVVKPASDTGAGQGITTGIDTPKKLRRAAIAAAGFGDKLLIERQIAGLNVRLLFLEGELLDAVHRKPPTVTGDGRSTISTLVTNENRRRSAGGHGVAQVALRFDSDMQATLARQGMHRRSVPAAGQRVPLKTVINDNAADENVPVVDRLSPATVEAARRAAAVLGVRLAGVDILIEELTADLAAGGVVLEVNTTPGLYIHQASGSANVAAPILEACLRRSIRETKPVENASSLEAAR